MGATASAAAPTHNFDVFDKLWNEWRYSRAGKDRVPKRVKAEIEKIGRRRMTDARMRYERYFESLETKNNQPLSARTWFTGAYADWLADEQNADGEMPCGYYRNADGNLVDRNGVVYE